MEFTIIQTSDQKNKGVPSQKEGGKQVRSPSSSYQKTSSQPTSPRRKEEQEKELEKTIFPKLQDSKNPTRCHGKHLQHGENLDGIKGQRGKKNETTLCVKKTTLSPDSFNTLTQIKRVFYL
ncbi:hypothetical protein O181_108037 [Austropuccinia psidii MF-1]|uniref:Uncharacterized protein n=1 Tax=Austropuccinia psidii MF-1 TaxID=1389203 RepID=A0A9Q3JV61_9BASI|nr:hypothetical protein [Austropuccinia psidii MF-1]